MFIIIIYIIIIGQFGCLSVSWVHVIGPWAWHVIGPHALGFPARSAGQAFPARWDWGMPHWERSVASFRLVNIIIIRPQRCICSLLKWVIFASFFYVCPVTSSDLWKSGWADFSAICTCSIGSGLSKYMQCGWGADRPTGMGSFGSRMG